MQLWAVLFINNCRNTPDVLNAFCAHHKEYLQLYQQPLVRVMSRDDVYPV